MLKKLFKITVGLICGLTIFAVILTVKYRKQIITPEFLSSLITSNISGLEKLNFKLSEIDSTKASFKHLDFQLKKEAFSVSPEIEGLLFNYSAYPFSAKSIDIKSLVLKGELLETTFKGIKTDRAKTISLTNWDNIIPLKKIEIEKGKVMLKGLPNISSSIMLEKKDPNLKLVFQNFESEQLPWPISLEIYNANIPKENNINGDYQLSFKDKKWLIGDLKIDIDKKQVSSDFKITNKKISSFTSLYSLPKQLKITNGTIATQGSAFYNDKKKLRLNIFSDFNSISGSYQDIIFNDVSTKLNIVKTNHFFLRNKPQVKISNINFGIPVDNIVFKLSSNKLEEIFIKDLLASILGGEIKIPYLEVVGKNQLSSFEIHGNGISFTEILSLYKRKDISITGSIDFLAPLKKDAKGNLYSKNGTFETSSSGKIQINTTKFTANLDPSNPLAKVSNILNDFNYSEMYGEFDYKADGTLTLNTKIIGSNPTFKNGREVHFNLNLEENIKNLLTSIRLNDAIEDNITKAFKEK